MPDHEYVPGIYPDEYYCLKCQQDIEDIRGTECEYHESVFPLVRKKPVSVLTRVLRSVTSAARGR